MVNLARKRGLPNWLKKLQWRFCKCKCGVLIQQRNEWISASICSAFFTRSSPQSGARRNATPLDSKTLPIFFIDIALDLMEKTFHDKWKSGQSAGNSSTGGRSCFFGIMTSTAPRMTSPAADRYHLKDGRKPRISEPTAKRFCCMSVQQNRIPHLTGWSA